MPVLQEILGHQYLTSTQVYLRRVRLPRMREAMEAAAATHHVDTNMTTTFATSPDVTLPP